MRHTREAGAENVKRRRPWIIAGAFGLAWLLLLLAGADRPPPPGFAVVLVILVALVAGTGMAIPWLWRVQAKSGARRVLGYCAALGATVGLAIAGGLAISGPGEPSTPAPSASATVTWLLVLTLVGSVNGVLVGGVTALVGRSSRGS